MSKRLEESWAVTVERNGESVVTIASNCLGGRDLLPGDEDVIQTAATHLLSFIGRHGSLGEAGARLRALVAKWRKEADEIDADGDFCCALTRRNDGHDLEVLLDALLSAPVVSPPQGKGLLKRRDTPESAAFWDFVEKTAREWREQEPEWSREIRRQAESAPVVTQEGE